MVMLSGLRNRKPLSTSKKLIMLLVAFPIIGLLIICNSFYYDIVEIKTQFKEDITSIEEQRTDAIFNILNGISREEKIHNQYIISKIVFDIGRVYGNNMDQLKIDLHSSEDSPIFDIFAESIDYDKELSDIYDFVPNSSSLFIADKNGILADSGYVERERSSRKWDEEIKAKKYRELSKNAINMLLNKSTDIIYWESDKDKSIYNRSLDIPSEPNDHTIKEIIRNNNITHLRNFNILIPSYITNTGDIFGVADVDDHGIRNDNDKLIVVREINMYDALEPYMGKISNYDYLLNRYEAEVQTNIHTKTITFLALSVICMIIVLVILYIANTQFTDNRGDEYDGSNNN